jgi:dCTP deaminase
MPLSDSAIRNYIDGKGITIQPYRPECVQPNSYDLHLGSKLLVYENIILDAKQEPKVEEIEIPEHGKVLEPGVLYLGVTEEYTEAGPYLVPYIDGKSSVGRLGLWVHVTAGGGDAGFHGFWTLELVAVQPVRIYAGMPIAQLRYEYADGEVEKPYGRKTSKYQNQEGTPVPSRMWKNWDEERKSWLPPETT